MAKEVGALLAVWSLLLAGEASAEVNYALQQPVYQLGYYSLSWIPDNAVDGNLDQNLGAGVCSHTATGSALPFPPWLVVRLSRWILPTAVHIYARGDVSGDTTHRDASDSYHVGPFWNDSLPRFVPTTLLSVDPLGGGRFFYLRTQNVTLYSAAGANQRFPLTTRASGLYFAIKSNVLTTPVDICEMMVFGTDNLLYGMNAVDRLSSVSPRVNLSMLTDENATTCWDALSLDTKSFFIVDFIPVSNLTTNFTVAVLTAGTVRPKVSDYATCIPGVYLAITTSENGICTFVQSVADGGKNYLSFTCTCTACTGIGVALVRRGAQLESRGLQCESVPLHPWGASAACPIGSSKPR